jgi:chitodextrinase
MSVWQRDQTVSAARWHRRARSGRSHLTRRLSTRSHQPAATQPSRSRAFRRRTPAVTQRAAFGAPDGALRVLATEDTALADAHPEFLWLILGGAGSTPADTTAPTVPTGLTVGTPTQTTVPLSWTASTDAVGVTGYKVRRGGTVVGTPTGTSFTDSGLTATTGYSYTVSAVDAAGNESAQTAAVTATTAAAPAADSTAPSISSFTATPGDGQVTLAWAGSDNVAITRWTVVRGGTTVYDGTGTSKTDTGLTNGTALTYTLTAYDAAGNTKTATATATPAAASGQLAAGTVIASDDFNRADSADTSNASTLGTTSVGGKTWILRTGFKARVVSNRALLVAANGSSSTRVTVDAGQADVDISFKVGSVASGDAETVIGRYVDETSFLAFGVYNATQFAVQRPGVLIQTITQTPAVGDILRLVCKGGTYTAYINGVQVWTGTVAAISTTSTSVGLSANNSGFTAYFDDFSVAAA